MSSCTMCTVSVPYKCRQKWTRIGRPKQLVEVKCPPQYQRCRLLDRYHTHLLARGVASCFWSVRFPDIERRRLVSPEGCLKSKSS